MTEEDEEFNRIEREAKQRMEAVSAALEKKADNARELGLDYEPAQQEPVAFYVYKPVLPRGNLGNVSDGDLPWVYDQDPSSGFSARMLVAPVTSPPAQRTWVGLTDEEKNQVAWSCGAMSADWLEFAEAIEAKLKEKNHG